MAVIYNIKGHARAIFLYASITPDIIPLKKIFQKLISSRRSVSFFSMDSGNLGMADLQSTSTLSIIKHFGYGPVLMRGDEKIRHCCSASKMQKALTVFDKQSGLLINNPAVSYSP